MRKYRLQNRNSSGSMFFSVEVDMIATVGVVDPGPDCRVLVTFGYHRAAGAVKTHAIVHAEAASLVEGLYDLIAEMCDEGVEYQASISTLASGGPTGICGANARVEIRGRDAIALAECAFCEGVVDP